MVCISLILILLPLAHSLSCPTFTDYTGDTVGCVSACPGGANPINSKCLRSNQYQIGAEVHQCERGWVDSQSSICCPKSQYIVMVGSTPSCARCPTRTYANGRLCCPGSHYADLTNSATPKCMPLGTGPCGDISIKNMLQVCCGSGNFYSIQ